MENLAVRDHALDLGQDQDVDMAETEMNMIANYYGHSVGTFECIIDGKSLHSFGSNSEGYWLNVFVANDDGDKLCIDKGNLLETCDGNSLHFWMYNFEII